LKILSLSKRADILVLLEKNSMTGCVDMVLTNQLLLDILATIILFLTLQWYREVTYTNTTVGAHRVKNPFSIQNICLSTGPTSAVGALRFIGSLILRAPTVDVGPL
jgi:hypothetical protein